MRWGRSCRRSWARWRRGGWLCLLPFLSHSSTALSTEPPPEPQPNEPVENECPEATPLPEEFSCRGVAVPSSQVADLLAWRVYSGELRELYRLDTTACESERDALSAQLHIANNPPFNELPGVQRWSGRAEGAVVGILVGALGWVILDSYLRE